MSVCEIGNHVLKHAIPDTATTNSELDAACGYFECKWLESRIERGVCPHLSGRCNCINDMDWDLLRRREVM